ncbi:DUF5685 family protein [Sphaerisporangium perillae]|uniref:DUF5685 family protein n=1 Tax=Sphaerisporangium perillae TaxID=2935860 RepID=UPI00200E7A5F|nr:DUF5685 family protein [Sphaerisporangium perillae]
MFGIIRPCGQHSCPSLHRAWLAHLCGLCLTLRDGQGQGARLATNYDGLIISVLAEAQGKAASPHRTAGPCALRGFRSADVVDARAHGVRLAATVSLILAAGKLRDHVADGDAAPGTGPARRRLAARWEEAGTRMGASIGFDVAVLTSATGRQLDLERRFRLDGEQRVRRERRWGPDAAPGPAHGLGLEGGAGLTLLDLTVPTEEAVAAAFAHTATLAGRPGNSAPLAEAGRFFGRLAHLLDAVEDQADDAERGAFNPLTATGTTREEARRLCDDAAHGLGLALSEVELEDRHLVDVLLGTEVRRAVERTFARSEPGASYERPGVVRKSAAGVVTFLTCGMWRPRWSRRNGRPCDDRCYLRFCDVCSGCDGCGDCCKCCDNCDGCCCDCSP